MPDATAETSSASPTPARNPARPLRWDLFCRVIDNYGDIGVSLRLARDLAHRGDEVRLWCDDLTRSPGCSRRRSRACAAALGRQRARLAGRRRRRDLRLRAAAALRRGDVRRAVRIRPGSSGVPQRRGLRRAQPTA
ncbi:hypothetical protein Ddc_20441 [Ditylenchus destructor]|nr:hypothetical protein Ddc_20441 [Ditylenchus destructor]